MTVLEFRNKLVQKLNNTNRYVGGTCNGWFYPEVETFDVDDVYEIIDELLKEASVKHSCGDCDHMRCYDWTICNACTCSYNSNPSNWLPRKV